MKADYLLGQHRRFTHSLPTTQQASGFLVLIKTREPAARALRSLGTPGSKAHLLLCNAQHPLTGV
jgi:membrane-bound metal-dependent hydrolase YbcI (DUF457 family)